mmetsp:Transcript_16274/g.41889  ORF Transcript_16274/g.41889 Transcript_16274/m.41889 type:complete len:92 (-) Transcript_16274:89-364(-)
MLGGFTKRTLELKHRAWQYYFVDALVGFFLVPALGGCWMQVSESCLFFRFHALCSFSLAGFALHMPPCVSRLWSDRCMDCFTRLWEAGTWT